MSAISKHCQSTYHDTLRGTVTVLAENYPFCLNWRVVNSHLWQFSFFFFFLGFHSKHCLHVSHDCDCFKHGTVHVRVKFYCRQRPDQIWVQCDNPECLKWRKLPDGTDPQKLPDKWYCKENPNPRMRSCSIPEEKEEEVEQPYVKTQKKRL